MNNRALITVGILLLLVGGLSLFAIFVPRTRRNVWIVGLSFALLVFGQWIVIAIIAFFTRGHLNGKGILTLLTNGYVEWILVQYLLQKIRAPRFHPPEL